LHLLKRVLTAVVLIPIVLVLILKAPVPVLAVVAGSVALLTVHELLKLSEAYRIQPLRWPTYIFVGLFFLLLAINPGNSTPLLSTASFSHTAIFAASLAPFVFVTIAMRRADLSTAFPAALVSAFSFAYVALPLGFLVQLREQWAGAFLLVYLLCLVWAGDICAYFVGKAMGRHRLSPRVSPNKTWEGAMASLLASVGVGVLLYEYALPISSALLRTHFIEQKDGYFGLQPPQLWPVFWISVAINLAAQLGDLIESLIKRGAGAKDSGAILPGHGGMLDRIDALLFAAPVLWYYAAWRVMQ
jgi:phosphatidate cytidylyltransferase